MNQQVKVVFGRYTAVKAIQERGPLNSAIKDAITATLKDDPMIIIESVQLENIEFCANYLHSIEQRMLAEVEVQKLQQNAEREKVQAQITVTQATAKANAVRAEAQANAEATRLNGEARAYQHQHHRRGRSRRHRSPRQGARHQSEPRHAGAGRTLERRAADHDGAGLGGAVRVGEIALSLKSGGEGREPRQRRWLSGRHTRSQHCYCDLSRSSPPSTGPLALVVVPSAEQLHGRQEEFA